ncbi:dTDP-4-dehydrorhamnose reductase [Nitrospinaceae bacterium]|nr:dTDP-4-dehydrorhamnose reductase [Nitrospinaceae bacterium]
MRILLTGKNGQVGNELNKILPQFGEVIATGRNEMNLADPSQIRRVVQQVKPELIINAGAYTAVDKAESDQELAKAVNGIAPKILAEEAKNKDALLIHYSTDYSYNGEMNHRPYLESDSPAPNSVYGKTKLEGDQAIEKSGASHLIFRTGWVYSKRGESFLHTILTLAKEKKELRIVNDQTGTPTWCRSIAEATCKAINNILEKREDSLSKTVSNISGVYHMTCQGETNWHGFAQMILELSCPDNMPKLLAISTKEYPTPAIRPTYSVLSNSKLKKNFGIQLPHWEHALKQCLSDIS